ncbi:RagB/SusD family nutrient uptake outer membrane protein [Mucilaginibacter sp. RS28]|uniref:RagB/SusD family nutrient uptake outer membrane protein n=1 Tax=Mucilaginibacter straminoryzae TaxID=2932774 RepID=A0A9X2BF06_9SPHI|nr:RagB/SusD family nutrient uptake outer membrane protein [Mucilaginibacter straminoryzae]MCJ8211998.1 RagB/SusD family nutrient uptake outer membrane protein [Mucilaginibacter straminoryzae]
MKKKFIYIIGMALLSSYSCKKQLLYPDNQTQVSNQGGAPFSTSSRIQAQVYGLYNGLKNGQLFGGRYQIYNDVKAENWINQTTNSVTAYQTWTETVSSTSSEVLNLWSQAYFVINNCNLFIEGMNSTGSAVVGASLAANYISEAKFVRATAYFALLNFYCQPYVVSNGNTPGLPLRLKGNSAYDNYDLAPSTVAQVYAQIISDLDAAEAGLPASYGTDAVSNTTRAHKNTAIAYKVRVYLAMQQYAKVITEASKIVSGTTSFSAPTGVANALQANVANVYKSPYTTTESIFSMPFTTTEAVGSQNALANYFGGLGASEFYLNPNGVIADANWKSTDARRTLITTKSGKSYSLKWPGGSPYLDYANVMRYPEVLLSYAEAIARSTNTVDPKAVALLNAVRQRSDPSTTYTTASFATVSALTDAILQERNIEFLGEGLRWLDLWRLNLPIPAKNSVAAVAPSSSNYIWPMSGNEQQYNKLIGR